MDGYLLTAIGALAGAIVVLWRIDRSRILKDLDDARAEATKWQRKWSDEMKERAKDSELFVKALEHARDKNSRPPSK